MDEHSERTVVRDLARQVREIAGRPAMEAVRQRWRDVNALRRPDRAPVWCRPVGCWVEILPESSLFCRTPWMRRIEREFRQILYKSSVDDDSPVEPWFEVTPAYDVTPPNLWGVDIRHRPSADQGGSWAYDPPLKSETDFNGLRLPRFVYNADKTREAMERIDDLMGDILPPRLAGGSPLGATLGTEAADLRGLDRMMLDMVENPALMHRLMGHLRDATLAAMDAAEAAGAVTPNHYGPMLCSDPIGDSAAEGRGAFRNQWGTANSQEFDQVSPAMWEEFCLAYQKPILARYGLVAYGCCENLTHKIRGVLSIPNLRIFVCSAWTDLDAVIEAVGANHGIMWRQKASDVVFPDDVGVLRRHLRDGARRLKGCRYQIVLRELQTLAGHPDRLHVWTRLAKEAAGEFA